MIDPKTGLEFISSVPDLKEKSPSDILPPNDRGDITNLDEDHLRRYIYSAFLNCITDKQDYGWVEKKKYAIESYYGKKNEAMKHWPFENASAFPVPLTPTILDTAWANVQSGLFADRENPIGIEGVGVEDIRPAGKLLKFLNWQLVNESDFEKESDKNVFRGFLHGTAVLKVIFDIKTNKVKIRSIDIENFFVPIDSTGVQREDTDIIVHIIPLSYADIQLRKAMKIYREPDAILPGANLILRDSDQIRISLDEISGMSIDTKIRRDNYYIAEIDVFNYIPPDAFRSLDLKVWMSPNGGTIQRIRKKDKKIKSPYAVAHCYPYADRFYSMGIPEKIRNVQEKIDYSDKQYTDSLDIASNPAIFVEDTDDMQRGRRQRVRGGIYPIGKGNRITWEPQPPIDRAQSQERAILWEMAERLTGVIDITQGRASSFGGKTLGEIEIRTARADVRFSNIFKRYAGQIEEAAKIIYQLDYMYVSEEKIIDVIGFSVSGYSVNELFPIKNGELVEHNFKITGYLESERNADEEKKIRFLDSQMTSLLVSSSEENIYNISNRMAELMGIRDYGNLVKRPKGTRIIGVDEFIQRVVSGDKSIQIRPGIDTDDYIFEIELFFRSGMFKNLEDYQKKLLLDAHRKATIMREAELRAQAKVKAEQIILGNILNDLKSEQNLPIKTEGSNIVQ